MGGRDYPPDFGTPNPDDDVGGRREAEREAFRQGEDAGYRRGMDEGYDLGRVAASNQGFSDAWDGGWKACQKWFIHERRRRQHRRGGLSRGGYCGKTGAEDPGRCACLDGTMEPLEWPDPPPQEERETEEREHGVGGVSEFEDLPQWARDALERHGITAAPERVAEAVARAEGEPGRVMSSQELRGLAQMREMEERVEAGLEPPGVWAASGYIKYGEDLEAASRQAERAERPLDGTAEDCDQDEYCFPVRQPGVGWWCKACDKPLRIVRPRFQSD